MRRRAHHCVIALKSAGEVRESVAPNSAGNVGPAFRAESQPAEPKLVSVFSRATADALRRAQALSRPSRRSPQAISERASDMLRWLASRSSFSVLPSWRALPTFARSCYGGHKHFWAIASELAGDSRAGDALPETGVTRYSGHMGDTLPLQVRRGHAVEGVSRHGRARPVHRPPA